ncbi:MAG TPA: FecR domain-containing protein [Polyangiaceae bacterium]|nr:FecR domain-containing protein [Polyangiaceae bacterium]
MRYGLAVRLGISLAVAAFGGALPAAAEAPSTLKLLDGGGTTTAGLFTASASGAKASLPSGATVTLGPDSAVRAFGRPQRLELERGGKTNTWSLSLTRGRLDVDVPAKPKSAVLVSTEKGSVFVMSGKATLVAEAGELYVVNSAGNVRTYVDNHFADLAAGHIAHFDAEHPRGVDEPVLSAPAIQRGSRLYFSTGAEAKTNDFSWTAVPHAVAYDVELRRGERTIAHRRVNEPRVADLAELAPGAYTVAVRAVDARGIEGSWADARPLRVIGVELPVGAYADGGGIYLAGGQKVKFSHTDGLEMTYLGAGKYLPASESVGLYRNERTVISFRFPGSDDNVIARLEPRDVYAEVFAGPKKAVWPRDPVELHVRMRTRAGGPVPNFLQISPKVELGVEPVEVEWRRENDDYYARVSPRPGKGPWVIRVDVTDQFGIALGHDFVEVAHQAGASEPPRAAPPTPNDKTSVRVASAKPGG